MKKLLSSSLLALSAAAFLPAGSGVVLAADAAVAEQAPAGAAAADAGSAAPVVPAAAEASAAPAQPESPAAPAKAAPAKKAGKGGKTGKKSGAKSGTKSGAKAGKGEKDAAEPVGVPKEIRDEMGKLIEQAIQVASPDLQAGDHFLPYGVLKLDDGALKVVRWQMPTAPSDLVVLAGIVRAMQVEIHQNPHVVAGVTVATTKVPTVDGKVMVSGLRAEVDHRRGVPQIVFIAYTKEDGKLVLGTPAYTLGVNPLFDHGPQAAPGTAQAPATAPAASAPSASAASAVAAPPADAAPAMPPAAADPAKP